MKSEHESRIIERIKTLLASQRFAVLSTQSTKGPYANLVAFASDEDLKHILFATPRSTRKFENISLEPRVALLVNNSQNLETAFHDAMAVTITGKASETEAKKNPDLFQTYLHKHPYLEDFIHSDTCAPMLVKVDHYYFVEKFQKVTELYI